MPLKLAGARRRGLHSLQRTSGEINLSISRPSGTMPDMTAFGIVLVVSSALGVLIALSMFIWAAREDGRDQKRRDARRPASPATCNPRGRGLHVRTRKRS